MDEMVEQVMSLCPQCHRDDVEMDLHVTGNVEITINHVLDGLVWTGIILGFCISTVNKSSVL